MAGIFKLFRIFFDFTMNLFFLVFLSTIIYRMWRIKVDWLTACVTLRESTVLYWFFFSNITLLFENSPANEKQARVALSYC